MLFRSRNAGQAARLEELITRIQEYLDGSIDTIEELDSRLPWSAPTPPYHVYQNIAVGTIRVW